MIYAFTNQLFELPLFEKDVLPSLLKYCHTCTSQGNKKGASAVQDETLAFVTDLLLYKCPLPATGEVLQNMDTYMLDFGTWYVNSILFPFSNFCIFLIG